MNTDLLAKCRAMNTDLWQKAQHEHRCGGRRLNMNTDVEAKVEHEHRCGGRWLNMNTDVEAEG